LVVFLVRIWFAFDFLYTILPLPVVLKRLAAARFVFIFGIRTHSFRGFLSAHNLKNIWREQ